ncbi:imidazole glycerol phosphate synthase subunit HisF [Anaerosphaera multitolerans]|nr:imidazole glycerol phosphate synthase cyclase subunit [Anaerosphaera multitolerans]
MVKKIVACLDCKNGKLVKGIQFSNIKEIDNPVERARYYLEKGIDEIIYYDITASLEGRKNQMDTAKKIGIYCSKFNVPFTVGGGISTLEDVESALQNGASKVSINSAAIKKPRFIQEAALKYGSEKIVAAIDVKKEGSSWSIYSKGGQENTHLNAVAFAKQLEKSGAGELCVNSIDSDGKKSGYDLELIETLASNLNIPIIASGGAGIKEDFKNAFEKGAASALGASVFHFNEVDIYELKNYLKLNNVEIC